MLSLIAIVLQAITPSSASQRLPVPTPAPPAPPAPAPSLHMRYPPQFSSAPRERYMVDVEIRGEGQVLWSGELRLATNQQTSVRRDLTQPGATACSEPRLGSVERTGLDLVLTPRAWSEADAGVEMTLRWGRPSGNACANFDGVSARTVELRDTIRLAPGQWVTVSGDAGLTLRIRRR
jgi:hypothetical protein